MLAKLLRYAVRFEPVISSTSIQAVLALILAFGFAPSAAVAGSILAAAAALTGLVTAAQVRPFTVSAVATLITAVGTLLVALKVPHIQSGEVAAISVFAMAVLDHITRSMVTPVAKLKASPAPATPPAPAAS